MYETSLIFKAPSKQVASGRQLERSNLGRQRTLVTSTHDEQTLLVRQQILGQRLQCLVHSQDLLDLSGNIVQAINDLLSSSSLEDRVVTQLNGNHDESDVLGSVGLGGGDTDLGTSLRVSSI